MKSAEQQEAVTAKVQETFAKYPTILDVPKFEGTSNKGQAVVHSDNQVDYITALYELFYMDSSAELAGRVGYALVSA